MPSTATTTCATATAIPNDGMLTAADVWAAGGANTRN